MLPDAVLCRGCETTKRAARNGVGCQNAPVSNRHVYPQVLFLILVAASRVVYVLVMPICFPRLHCRHHRRRRRRRRRHRHLHRHSYYSIIPASPVPPLQKHDAVQAARATISPPCKTQPRLDFYNTPAIRNAQP